MNNFLAELADIFEGLEEGVRRALRWIVQLASVAAFLLITSILYTNVRSAVMGELAQYTQARDATLIAATVTGMWVLELFRIQLRMHHTSLEFIAHLIVGTIALFVDIGIVVAVIIGHSVPRLFPLVVTAAYALSYFIQTVLGAIADMRDEGKVNVRPNAPDRRSRTETDTVSGADARYRRFDEPT